MRSIVDAHVLLIGTGDHDTRPVETGSSTYRRSPPRSPTCEQPSPSSARCSRTGYAYCTIPPIRSDGIGQYVIGHGLVSLPGALHPAHLRRERNRTVRRP
ncbi:hypothetical protein [Actinoplanes derwentensis]|uniref:hypothetical protein n=1 Tax=Actinoplanes derwentensis TaxID=113562 RepID=UPI0012FE1772|nr:hypothetical protein [Actinoplanes derwentensis]GID85252.1 hypothetical protein Ade03nite_41760 [Actinoplanes derwentensis]